MSVEHLSTGSSNPPLADGKIRLYSMRFCPYAERVHLVLNAKNIPYDVVYINLAVKPDWYLDKIPTGKVPALVTEGTDLYESLVIADFLDEKYPNNKLHSSDPLKKAKDRLLVENFGKVTGGLYKVYFSSPEEKPRLFDDVLEDVEIFEKELVDRGSPYFSGENPGMADYMIWPWFERLPVIPLIFNDLKYSEDRFPTLKKWKENLLQDKAIAAHALTPEQHAYHLKNKIAGTPNYDII